MTTVADEGNKRVGDMSGAEMEQCIQGAVILNVYER